MHKNTNVIFNNNSRGGGGDVVVSNGEGDTIKNQCIKNRKQQPKQPNDVGDDNQISNDYNIDDEDDGDGICRKQKTNNQIITKIIDDDQQQATSVGAEVTDNAEEEDNTFNTKMKQEECSIRNSQQLLCKQQLNRKRCYVSLACSIGSMSLACGSLLQIPNSTDRITLQRGLFLTSLGFIYFISLTDFCNKYLLETSHGLKFRKKYRLMMSDVMEITNKIVSAIQASFSFLVGFIVCKSTCTKSFVYASHFLMEAYGWFGTAYFMYDIWSMYKVHTQKIADKLNLRLLTTSTTTTNRRTKNTTTTTSNTSTTGTNTKINGHFYNVNGSRGGGGDGEEVNQLSSINGAGMVNNNGNRQQQQQQHDDDLYDYNGICLHQPIEGRWDFLKYVFTHPVMMIHHVFIGTFGLLVVTYIRGGGHCIYSYMFMMEFSTPFVSMRSILSTMGLKESLAYIINGLGMLGAFFFCRVFMWPYVMWRYSIAIDATLIEALNSLPRGCIISILILFLPQLYWFYLMVKGALKVFFPNEKQQKQQKQQTIPSETVADTSTAKCNKNPLDDDGNEKSNSPLSPEFSESSVKKLKHFDKNLSTDSKPTTATTNIMQTTQSSCYILQKEDILSQAVLDDTFQSSSMALPVSSPPSTSNGTN